jgi:hypothetical protein
MLRFNPDKYEGKCCFTYDDRNILHPMAEVWDRRSNLLAMHLTHHLENIPTREVTVIHFFYLGQAVPAYEV